MKRLLPHLPLFVTLALAALLALHGPILQPDDYHAFADARPLLGLPNAADVLSNLGFAIAGIWGLLATGASIKASPGRAGYTLFLVALVLTAAGSAYYHWQPDDARLVWDRIPIALACAGLLAAMHAETTRSAHGARHTALLAIAAVASVLWWHASADLRPYLLLQILPLVLIPLWQWQGRAPRRERLGFGLAILLYVLAKAAELADHHVLDASALLSGHTLKHLLATTAAFAIVACLVRREQAGADGPPAMMDALAGAKRR